jgi:protein ImuB
MRRKWKIIRRCRKKYGTAKPGLQDERIAELLDRLSCKIGMSSIHRYLPDEHYWPERSMKKCFVTG